VDLIRQAQQSDEEDRKLTIRQAVVKYKKAVLWAMFLSTSLVMEGYDLVLVSESILRFSSVRPPLIKSNARSAPFTVRPSSKNDLVYTMKHRNRNSFRPSGNPASRILPWLANWPG
jgi:hypothetical protein